jgi:hypothetical protein
MQLTSRALLRLVVSLGCACACTGEVSGNSQDGSAAATVAMPTAPVESVGADTAFLAWWSAMVTAPSVLPPPPGVRTDHRNLLMWPAAPTRRPGARGFALATVGGMPVTLWVPTDAGGPPASAAVSCAAGRGQLVAGTGDVGAAVDVTPFCADNEVYGPQEVSVTLYWIRDEEWPFVEVVTNHPAHIPFYLFRYDPIRRNYILVREGHGV